MAVEAPIRTAQKRELPMGQIKENIHPTERHHTSQDDLYGNGLIKFWDLTGIVQPASVQDVHDRADGTQVDIIKGVYTHNPLRAETVYNVAADVQRQLFRLRYPRTTTK